ncbi:hypothetical protein IQ07DRAFT_604808 [Pyrenochaeta sp. DS3sAY3a]|nr:hypothetical protein IQ07DRAFT_604808 [Pyrenochaeta sp. DS3sAY3a]
MKSELPTPTTTRAALQPRPSRRPLLLILLLICSTLTYHISASFSLRLNMPPSFIFSQHQTSLCTKEIGSSGCCALYLDAAPCLDECRKEYVDRETLVLTAEYEGCAGTCLARYEDVCLTP